MKVTGKEWLAFLESDWGHPDAHYEDDVVLVNGELVDHSVENNIQPTDVVDVQEGYIWMPDGDKDLVKTLKAWLKKQKVRTLILEVSAETFEDFEAILKQIDAIKNVKVVK